MNMQVPVVINRPVQDVFAYVADFENHPKWEANFVEVKRVTPDPIGAGTVYQCWLRFPGQRVGSRIELTEFVPDRRISFTGDAPASARPVGTMTFEPVDGGTRLTAIPQPQFGGVFKLLGPLMAGYIRRSNVKHLQQLKALLEA